MSEKWKVVLHPDQTVPGALLIVSLRHVAKIDDLSLDGADELFGLCGTALEETLGASMEPPVSSQLGL